jgi:hypothetical protein
LQIGATIRWRVHPLAPGEAWLCVKERCTRARNECVRNFPAQFTRRGYNIVSSPSRLANSMCGLFARLLVG